MPRLSDAESDHNVEKDILRITVSLLMTALTCDLTLRTFFDDNVYLFLDGCGTEGEDINDGEHSFEWSDCFQEFEVIMEHEITKISERLEFDTPELFFLALKKKIDEDDSSDLKESRMMDMIIACYDYSKFVALMKLKARRVKLEAKTDVILPHSPLGHVRSQLGSFNPKLEMAAAGITNGNKHRNKSDSICSLESESKSNDDRGSSVRWGCESKYDSSESEARDTLGSDEEKKAKFENEERRNKLVVGTGKAVNLKYRKLCFANNIWNFICTSLKIVLK